MARALTWLFVVALAGGCGRDEVCPPGMEVVPDPVEPDPRAGFFGIAHAHNDYEHERPLFDALDHGFHSVEADVWYRDGEVIVSHDIFTEKGTLEDLYLQPLRKWLDDHHATIFADQEPFTLWLDLKHNSNELRSSLRALLDDADFLQRYDAHGDPVTEPGRRGLVNVILTGDASAKRTLVEEGEYPLPFLRDSNDFSVDDGAADDPFRAYALPFSDTLGWNGRSDEPPAEARQKAACIVEQAHLDGRKVRFYGGPDNEVVWDLLTDVGVDFLGADDLAGLAAYLRSR